VSSVCGALSRAEARYRSVTYDRSPFVGCAPTEKSLAGLQAKSGYVGDVLEQLAKPGQSGAGAQTAPDALPYSLTCT